MAGRRLDDPPLPAVVNMARDEALLEARATPTLRFYRWARPTLSLGYFQAAAGLPLDAVRRRGGEIVRRSTGGKAILHEHELTYSLCAPEEGLLGGGPGAAMERLHLALAAELSRRSARPVRLRRDACLESDVPGSPWCFEDSSPLDLVLERRKLLGSAARRRRGWILFHGSLVIRAPQETPSAGELGAEPDLDSMARALAAALDVELAAGAWRAEELAAAERLAASRYARDSFTLRL